MGLLIMRFFAHIIFPGHPYPFIRYYTRYYMTMKYTFLLLMILPLHVVSQGVTIGTNNPPDPSAILDLQSANSGFALPRLTTVQRNAISNPVTGLQVYNTDTDCIEAYFPLGGWKSLQCDCNAFPNATFSVPNAYINSPVTISSPVPNMLYNWTFQNGNPGTSGSSSTQVTWNSAGTFAITLTVTDSAGCSATHTDSITVSLCQPTVYNFTTCGQTGLAGPSQNQCNATYGPGVVTVNGGIQQWIVPATATYTITVAGAKGGNGYSGSSSTLLQGEEGVIISADILLNQGDILHILAGQVGSQPSTTGTPGGGGGGTFVVRSGAPILVAGGGTGNGQYGAAKGVTTTNGGNNGGGTLGGTNGSGGQAGTRGAGGGGFSGNGDPSTSLNPVPSLPGFAFLNGGNGGAGANWGCSWTNGTGEGGFGGGASGGGACNPNGGAGGGYSGGAGGSNNVSGGGGSFIHASATNVQTSNGQYNNSSIHNGTSIQNSNTYNTGDGYVTITRICP